MSAIDNTMKTLPKVWNQQFPESVLQPIQFEAAKRFRKFQLPTTLEEWEKVRPELYRKVAEAMRLKVDHSLPLEYEEHGTIQLDDGITLKKVCYCAVPGRYVTASLYIPDGEGPFPAILHPHGHRQQGKIAPNVQTRAQVFAKSGYVVLVVDAFGAGERTSTHPIPEYHGMYRGASLMNIGETLMGIQVADNMRGIDVLQSLPFVDKEKIGVTGCSGGGNQTMYLAAMDDRVKAAIPVCSPGTYESYLYTSNCYCEVMPGGLNFTEEAGILALTAPRALKLCSNINDGLCFSIQEMLRAAYEARKVYDAYGVGNKFQHEGFPGNHGYWQKNMEAAVGFFDLHLKGIGNGAAHPVPDGASLPESDVLVWEAGKAPAKLKGLKAWSNEQAVALAEKRKQNSDAAEVKQNLKKLLIDAKEIQIKSADKLPDADGWMLYSIDAGDVMIPVLFRKGQTDRCRILASDLDKANLFKSDIYQAAKDCTDSVLIFEPYGSGEMYGLKFSLTGDVEYHNLARYCVWYGHSMLGIWVQEYNLLAQWAKETFGVSKFSYEGLRDAGAAAIFAAVLFGNADKVTAEKTVFSMNLVESVFRAEAATLALTVQDILLYADIANAIGLSNADVKFIKPMHGDNTALSAGELAAFQEECNKETVRFGMKTQLTIEG